MQRLIVVSNRVASPEPGVAPSGGLAVGVAGMLARIGGVWLGWSGRVSEGESGVTTVTSISRDVSYATFDLSEADRDAYYNGFSNEALWPLLHYRLDLTRFDAAQLDAYRKVNRQFARRVRELIGPDDLVWAHDYHLIPLARCLREKGVERPIGFFLHTPFPPRQIAASMPRHKEVFRDLAAYDLVGFQTEGDRDCFLDYVRVELGGSLLADGAFFAQGRYGRAGVFPIGLDLDNVVGMAERAEASPRVARLRRRFADRDLVIGVDRLDYTKGIAERFRAYAEMLSRRGEGARPASLLQIAQPTRLGVPSYVALRDQASRLAGEINARHSDLEGVAIHLLNRSFSRETLAGLYRASRAGLVTPFRDGMNLVAKEYVAAQRPDDPGALVLSRFAGAAHELACGALLVNPHDVGEMASAIEKALALRHGERVERWSAMMDALRRNTVDHWCAGFVRELQAIRTDRVALVSGPAA
jgi:trehalose 6-phosphate synthase